MIFSMTAIFALLFAASAVAWLGISIPHLIHHIASLPPIHLPLVGDLRDWQLAFVVVGLSGFALVAMMFTIREPPRQDQVRGGLDADAGGHATLRAAIRFMRARWTAFGTLFVGSAAVVTMGSLSFWNVALFARTWGWDVRQVGITTGVLFFIGGTVGTLLGVVLTKRWIAAGRKDATLRALWTGLAIAVPGFALYPLMPSAELAVGMQFFAFTGQATAAAAGPASITLIAPGQMKAQATAIYYLFVGVFGQLIGPPPVGLMTDLFGDPGRLRYAMTIEALTVGTLALVLVRIGMSRYRRCVIEVDSLIDPLERRAHA